MCSVLPINTPRARDVAPSCNHGGYDNYKRNQSDRKSKWAKMAGYKCRVTTTRAMQKATLRDVDFHHVGNTVFSVDRTKMLKPVQACGNVACATDGFRQ